MLSQFETNVLWTAVIGLIAALAIVGLLLSKTSAASTYPTPTCPDFWYSSYIQPCASTTYGCCSDHTTSKVDASGSNCGVDCAASAYGCCSDGTTQMLDASGSNCTGAAKCYNLYNLGNTSTAGCMVQDFTTSNYAGTAGVCQKQTWAKTCGVSWDGVTNIDSAC